ncbi:MAG: N-6 DNA methylase [Ignavibacteria bacterium]|nr:N-6 DNA methylase [Ignavibacteria bacterium]
MSLESAYSLIEKLVNDFNANEKHYLASDYSESQARLDFIDKLFIALGWDVNHEHQKNPYEQEVKVERRVKDKETQKRADYAFFLSPNYRDPKFYVEAKKPSRSLANPYDSFQAIRYGWNAQTPLVVLTDFEEFHILDSRYKPDIKYTKERKVLSFHYTEYTDKEKFSKLYYLFSREAVESGSIEKFAETMPKPRGKAVQKGLFPGSYQSIDESFLEELDEIRNTLARSFKKKNPALTSEELTEATQRTIDRLVFIRFLEDMLIEGEHHISTYGDKGTAWGDFIADCRSLNAKYNGIVFKEHFIDRLPLNNGEIQRGSNTAIVPDDKDFEDICKELSHINSPYNFNSIPIHILGSIYERFLGKVVHATDKRVTIEEKPEVRKAGGVYYTPQYIVQYIVDNTVGKLIEGKTPAEISKLRFADISCGSGSFLITVYDTLLRYHSKYYQLNPKEAKADGCIFSNGLWVLSLKQKRQILLNNVYGVDIDHQAVEVTQLSLYLKLLEDETLATANEMQAMFKEKILPDLSKNIICGNSLIGTDIYTNDAPLLAKEGWREATGWSEEEEKKINAMNFEDAFPAIMKNGGFDAIVGNPPYVRIQIFKETTPKIADYLKKYYLSAKSGNYDLYVVFIEKAIYSINQRGLTSFIVPNKFFTTDYGENIRKFIYAGNLLNTILDFRQQQIFVNATTYTSIIVLQKKSTNSFRFSKPSVSNLREDKIEYITYDISEIGTEWEFENLKFKSIIEKLELNTTELLQLPCEISRGSSSGNDKIFMLDESEFTKNNIEAEISRVPIFATDFKRYLFNPINTFRIIFPYYFINDGFELIGEAELNERFPNAYKYLIQNKLQLKKRKQFKEWYSYSAPRNLKLHENSQILIPLLAEKGSFSLISGNSKYCLMASGGFSITVLNQNYSEKYVLGLINSKLLFWYLRNISNIFRGGWVTCTKQYFGRLKIKNIKDENKNIYYAIIENVDNLIKTKSVLNRVNTDKDKTFYENKSNALDRQIDRLVYELYGLTEEEIKIVEGD